MSDDKRSLHLIQALRGVAAVMVVVHHASTIPAEELGGTRLKWENGAAGVDIFFVISGFVMLLSAQSLMRKASPATEFIQRRVERIVPIYWIFTTLKILLTLAVPAAGARALGGIVGMVGSYLFFARLPVVAVGWTLNFEMFFYALFALALAVKVRPIRILTPLLILISLIPVVMHSRAGAWFWFDPIVLEFLFGMLLYEAYRSKLLLPKAASWIAAAAGFATILLIPWGAQLIPRPWVWGVPALAIVAASIGLESSLGERVPRWLLTIGDASYSIYLSHTFVVHGAALLCRHYQPLAQRTQDLIVVALVFASIAAGWLVYRFVERPIIHFFRDRRMAPVPVNV